MADRRSLKTTRGTVPSRRSKPLVAKAGFTRSRTPYKCGGGRKTSK